jgi:hypothetical protein
MHTDTRYYRKRQGIYAYVITKSQANAPEEPSHVVRWMQLKQHQARIITQ